MNQEKTNLISTHWVQRLYDLISEEGFDFNQLGRINPALFMEQVNQPFELEITGMNNLRVYSFSSTKEKKLTDTRSFPIIKDNDMIATLTISFPAYNADFSLLCNAMLFSLLPSCLYTILVCLKTKKHQQSLSEIYDHLMQEDIPQITTVRHGRSSKHALSQGIITEIHKQKAVVTHLKNIRKNMVADFAHELRTPISIMSMKLEARIENHEILSQEEMYLLMEELYRITKMVTDLQNLSLAEAGTLSLNKEWFLLHELLYHVVELLEPYAEEVGIEINMQLEQEFLVYADRDYMKQVCMNLIYNALQHSNHAIQIEANQEDKYIFFSVIDDGNGIEEEEIPYVFERFYRSPKSSNTRGMGLGLAIARSLVAAHTGSIELQSNWGQGTSFFVKFPVFVE